MEGSPAHMALPPDHPHRLKLNDEVHARPPESLVAPQRLSYLAMLSDEGSRDSDWQQFCDLLKHFDVAAPEPGANHYRVYVGPLGVKWERHTEFNRFTFIATGASAEPFAEPPILNVPQQWLSDLSGELIVAAHIDLVRDSDETEDYDDIGARLFAGNPLVGASVAGGAATALTDFRIHGDRFSRLLVRDRGMTPRQAGRMVQRLLEIDTYRVLALLALPVAQQLSPFLRKCEDELSEITSALASNDARDEPVLLDRLTQLAAQVGSRESDTRYRFTAAAAYYELVKQRIVDLRESRIQGLQTFKEFNERRLSPAMNTCMATAERQRHLTRELSQATQLLSTRVGMTRERQNQALLESMNRRAKLQLRLQQTVEGLSIAAITYYIVGLIDYAGEGLASSGLGVNPTVITAISIPVIAVLVGLGVRKVRRLVSRTDTKR